MFNYICYGALFSHICVKIIICDLFCKLSVKCCDFYKNRTNLCHMVNLPCKCTRQISFPCTHARQSVHVAPTCAPGNMQDDHMVDMPCDQASAHGKGRRPRVWAEVLCRALSRRAHGKGGLCAVHNRDKHTAKPGDVPCITVTSTRQSPVMCRAYP